MTSRLRCPHCVRTAPGILVRNGNWLLCQEPGCHRKYPIRDGLPIMLIDEGEKWTDLEWEELPSRTLPARPAVRDPAWLAWKAQEQRLAILQMVVRSGNGHLGGALSIIDVVTALYFRTLRHDPGNPDWPERDRLIFSKGHGCLALYVTLAESGYFPRARLREFCRDGGLLGGHPERGQIPGVEATTGSLGHGLPLAVGMAMAARMDRADHRIFVILSDGECHEGSVWEALMSAAQHRLDRLVAVIDDNQFISLGPTASIVNIEPMAQRLRAFGWGVREIDGHDMPQIVEALEAVPFEAGKPSAILAHTIKGKGVSFMENVPMWHLRNPAKEEARRAFVELAQALGR